MRAVVTGGAGFIGSHLVDALVARGDDLLVFDNLYRGRVANLQSHIDADAVRLQIADVRDIDAVREAIEGAEVVYHLAAQPNVMGAVADVEYSLTTNVQGTVNVLTAAAEASARRVVFASSREVYGEPTVLPVAEDAPIAPKNPYGASKAAAEAYCGAWQASRSLDVAVLRFTNVYGPRDRDRVIPTWLERATAGGDVLLYGGDQVVDFCWIDTAVAALIAAAEEPNAGPVNVGSGRGTRLRDLADRVLDLTGGCSRIVIEPPRGPEVVRFVADVTKMTRVLGIEPASDPLAGLATMIAAAHA